MMSPGKVEMCAHPLCSCSATSGKFCSVECESMAKTPDIACLCAHTECKGNTQSSASVPLESPS
jgi:hypothetical protein